MSLRSTWNRVRAVRGERLVLVLEAAYRLLGARLAIAILPFPRIARGLGALHAPAEAGSYGGSDVASARAIGSAVARAAQLLPFRVACLARALAAQRMLTRRKLDCRVHFGASPGSPGEPIRTHAWVDCGAVGVSGFPEAYRCAELGYYARQCAGGRQDRG